uniref:Uncharacterized protein n=1 Tax=Mucochytrium quahogii TaxID=96639 RepID=A0A7S2W6A4_9STRA|mmetsp:Transcript_26325/g.42642  ORF Transcript_26325/g.42642 Transcript_26325/m.42642 type:complete len:716 (-) Transcript_26325:1723-3870(-)
MDRDSVLRAQAVAGEVKKLKGERALLKRALLAEKDAVTGLKVDLQAKETEARSLLEKVDALTDERTRLAAVASQLKNELAVERQAASASITGGSMFNTFISSADGSASEIVRLQKQVKVTEEELENQLKNTAKIHQEMIEMKREHERTVLVLQEKSSQAVKEAELLGVQMDQAAGELKFVKGERTELKTQLDAKMVLVHELSRKLEEKTEALEYLTELRQNDLREIREQFKAKVPFNDTKDSYVVSTCACRPRYTLRSKLRFVLEDCVVEQVRKIGSAMFQLLADCKRMVCSGPVCKELTNICNDMHSLNKSLPIWVSVCRYPRPTKKENSSVLLERMRAEFETIVKRYGSFLDACAIDTVFSDETLQGHTSAVGHVETLKHKLLSPTPAPMEQIVGVVSDIASAFRIITAEHGEQGGAIEVMRANCQSLGEAFGSIAKVLHDYVLQARGLDADTHFRKQSRKFLSKLNEKKIIQSVPQSQAVGLQEKVSELQQKCTFQSEKLLKLESQYHQVRTELTTKEKLLQGLEQHHNADHVSAVHGGDEEKKIIRHYGAYKIVVVENNEELLSENPLAPSEEEIKREEEMAQYYTLQLESLSEKIRLADLKAIQMRDKYEAATKRNDKLSQDQQKYQRDISRFQDQVDMMRKSAAEELQLTRSSYDSQLKQLTQHMMRLNDAEQDKESEISRLRAKLEVQVSSPRSVHADSSKHRNPFED